MPLFPLLLQFAFLGHFALASRLPACSSTSVTPCRCPNGTMYQESSTFAVIGAPAADVRTLLAPFLETTWFGYLPYATTGTNFQPGATRSYTFPTSIGIYNITEQLTFFHTDPSASFTWKFEQAPFNVPVEYRTGNGSFSGYWAMMESQRVFQNETAIVWTVYLCATGHPLNFAEFQAFSLNNAISILTSEGKVAGKTIKPISIQSF